jgi:type VI secretion system protein ImpM
VTAVPATAGLGFFGKLPARGDFVTRRLPAEFVAPWDAWLQEAIAESAARMGDAWLDAFLTAPLGRFLIGREVCGPNAAAGVLMPSVDGVGRYFPLTFAVPLPSPLRPASAALKESAWFADVEEVALLALHHDASLEELDRRAATMGPPAVGAEGTSRRLGRSVAIERTVPEDPDRVALEMLDLVLADRPFGLWWTDGSEKIAPRIVVTPGLPPPEGFAAFLDGDWDRWAWKTP